MEEVLKQSLAAKRMGILKANLEGREAGGIRIMRERGRGGLEVNSGIEGVEARRGEREIKSLEVREVEGGKVR